VNHIRFIVLLLLSFDAAQAAPGEPRSIRSMLEEASQHLERWEVKQHEELVVHAWELREGPRGDRVEAGVTFAHNLLAIEHQPEEARKILLAAKALGARPALPALELAELETFEGHFAAACEEALAALSAATDTEERRNAQTRFGQAVCEELLQGILRAQGPATNAETAARIRQAVELIDPLMQNEPGWRDPSRCQILLALMAGNGPAALRAWRSYYLLVPGETEPRVRPKSPHDLGDLAFENGQWTNRPLAFTEPGEILEQILPVFTADALQARQKVVRALAGGRFFPEAATLALHWGLDSDKTIEEIIVYGRWYDDLSRRVAEEYRRHARGKSYRTRLFSFDFGRSRIQKLVEAESKELWLKRHPQAGAPPYRGTDSAIDLRLAFGAVTRALETPDFFSFGHSILASDYAIEQYGRKKVMRCITVDSLIANGYGDWLLGTGMGIGGWASPPAEFVQVRSDWHPWVWDTFAEPVLYRQRIGDRLEPLGAEDEQRAKTNACGYFPGLALRLFARGNERLLNRLKEQGLNGPGLRIAFLLERQRLIFPAHILAHEGRHVLDVNETNGLSSADLEFRAKCSQVAFAPDPLLVVGVGDIFSPNIGLHDNGHGAANTRVMRGLVEWMKTHTKEITDLDESRPLLPQFDRLSDEQMRAAFRSMDPWAKSR
jgi:hypothetical protein